MSELSINLKNYIKHYILVMHDNEKIVDLYLYTSIKSKFENFNWKFYFGPVCAYLMPSCKVILFQQTGKGEHQSIRDLHLPVRYLSYRMKAESSKMIWVPSLAGPCFR